MTASSITALRSHAVALVTLLALLITTPLAQAASLIRDPDIEHALRKMAAPILSAAGLGNNVQILLVNDKSLNAFVVDPQHIFIHTGMIMQMDTPEMLQAVIAHEAAHIANGHLTRRQANLDSARSTAGLGLALALAAAAASGRGDVAAGVALGTQSAALRQFLAHTRAEEASADQSAVRYMASAGIDPAGAVDVHKIFEGQDLLNVSRQDPYMRSHPLSRDRVRAMERFVAAYTGKSRPQPEMEYWYDRARSKLTAFLRPTKWTLQRAGDSRSEDVRQMRLAVAYHRQQNTSQAIAHINKAIAARPNDAFYYELKGQILLESRQFQNAVNAYRKAAQLAPRNPLILGGLGRALLTVNRPKEALKHLENARSRDFRNGKLLRDLGSAYAQNGQPGLASLATAERYALANRLKDADIHAQRALTRLPRGSSAARRAQDIVSAAKRANKKK
ncbi:M48 family metalloprotease [Shimia sp. MMG029]|uniref:M48 family metalloprotease n=1 Tax=Shimia sp. MMG029 TaxID=3021978 RepID=UPI0022FE18FD|nr:M48 family metalloprotease [Shimia sp. MMG029]MDA5555345.1 M48 family metalloprotease [Shimia sp. MMG029]